MWERDHEPGMQVSAAEAGKGREVGSPHRAPENQPYWYLGFNPVSLDFGILIFRTVRYLLSGFEPLDFGKLLQRSQDLIQWSTCYDKWNRRANASLVLVHTRVHIRTHTNIYAYFMCALVAGYCVVFLAAACGKATASWGVAGWTGLVLWAVLTAWESSLSRAAELASPSCLSQSLIVLTAKAKWKSGLQDAYGESADLGSSNTWAHLQITRLVSDRVSHES